MIIHGELVGFISGMQGWFKVTKSVNEIHHIMILRLKLHDNHNRDFIKGSNALLSI